MTARVDFEITSWRLGGRFLCHFLMRISDAEIRARIYGDARVSTAARASRPYFGALLLAYYDPDGRLLYAGPDAFQVGLTKPMPSPSRVDRARQETVNGEWSLEEACDRFIAAHVNGAWTAKTETQHRSTLDMFKRWAEPGTPLSQINRLTGAWSETSRC
jgi:hypothetical protein